VSLHPSDLRAGDWVYLAELDWLGQTIRVAESAVSGVPFGAFGASVDYAPGLDIGGALTSEFDLFAIVPADRSITATLDLSSLHDVPSLIMDGHSPLGAELRIYHHPAGSTRRVEKFRGTVTAEDHGTKKDPLSVAASASSAEDVGRVHGPWDKQRHIDIVRDDEQQDTWLPVVFGAPGSGSASTDPEDHAYGSPAFGMSQLAAPTDAVTIAAHETRAADTAGTVFYWNKTRDYSGSINVEHLSTVRGETVTIGDITGETPPKWEIGNEIWVDWGASAGGLMANSSGALVRGAGDVLLWMASRAKGVAVDLPRIESIRDRLNRYKIDVAVWGTDGEHVRPLDWVREYLQPMLPIGAVSGPHGLYYAVWDPIATTHDAVASIDTEANAARASDVESSELVDVVNDITVRYGFDAKSGRPTKEKRVTGDPVIAAQAGSARLGLWAQRSHQRHGPRVADPVDLMAVWDDATAEMAAAWIERRHAMVTYSVSFAVRPELAWLSPGAVVTVSAKDIGLNSRVALVEAVTPDRSGSVLVRVRVYDLG
jgi:hypothetical protein